MFGKGPCFMLQDAYSISSVVGAGGRLIGTPVATVLVTKLMLKLWGVKLAKDVVSHNKMRRSSSVLGGGRRLVVAPMAAASFSNRLIQVKG